MMDFPRDPRVLGRYSSDAPGPLLILVGGMHGNEPAGVAASRAVLAALEERRPRLRGRLLALTGNIEALARGVRYVDRDLNRMWRDDAVDPERERVHEESEKQALQAEIEAAIAEVAGQRVLLLDLHSTSAEGAPFCIMSDTLQNRPVAMALKVPVILGLEETIEGTLLEYFGERGHTAICLEGGQHAGAATAAHHEAAVWVMLVASGMLAEGDAPGFGEHRALLRRAGGGLPRFVEIRHRHAIPEGEPFVMEPGFRHFEHVEAGQLLARGGYEGEREVHAPHDGFLVMPRYQGLGDDGFFLGREVRRVWLRLSTALRRLRLGRLLPLLPGIRRHPERREWLVADPRVARWFTTEIFHLFGYRSAGPLGRKLVFVRRLEGPPAR